MKDAFLYEYLKYMKDELKYLNSEEKYDQVNVIKSIICSDTRGNIKADYLNQKEALDKLSDLVESIKIMKNEKTDSKNKEKTLTKHTLKKYEKVLKKSNNI